MARQRRVNGKPHGGTYKPLWQVHEIYESGVGFSWVAW